MASMGEWKTTRRTSKLTAMMLKKATRDKDEICFRRLSGRIIKVETAHIIDVRAVKTLEV